MNRAESKFSSGLRRLKRPLALIGLVQLPFLYTPISAFSDNHAFLVNASPSLPHWGFWVTKGQHIEAGDLIFFEPAQSKLLQSHFGETPQIFGKRVLGVPGDHVHHDQGRVLINGISVATTKQRTRKGFKLTKGPEGIIPDGCYYAGTPHKHGFDSRYAEIGWVCGAQTIGTGRPIL